MAHTSVSGCVMNIVVSFSSGLDVLRKLQETRRRRRRPGASKIAGDDQKRLSKSLRQGPEDVAREYRKSVQKAGDQVAVGDGNVSVDVYEAHGLTIPPAIAQTSLAEVLLRLNTGLVGIITSFLSRDKKDLDLDYGALTDLSESSRIDTCRALRALCQRMLGSRLRPDADNRSQSARQESLSAKERRRRQVPKQAKIAGPTLARVVIQDSSKPSRIALVKPGERKKRVDTSLASSTARTASTPSLTLPPPYEAAAAKPTRLPVQRSQTEPVVPKVRHKQSVPTLQCHSPTREPDLLRATRSTPRLRMEPVPQVRPVPPQLSTRPLPSMRAMPRLRKETPTYYSINSGSTKLGEIPLHRWAQPFDFDAMSAMNREARENGWPVPDADMAVKERRRGFFGLFRRK